MLTFPALFCRIMEAFWALKLGTLLHSLSTALFRCYGVLMLLSPRHPLDPRRPRHANIFASHRTRPQTTTRLPHGSSAKIAQESRGRLAKLSVPGAGRPTTPPATLPARAIVVTKQTGSGTRYKARGTLLHRPTEATPRHLYVAPPSHQTDRFSSLFWTLAQEKAGDTQQAAD